MNKLPNSHKCTGCMSCGDVCPKDCIHFAIQKDGHFMPIIDKNECIDCLRCVNVCPVNGIKKELSLKSTPYASWTNNDKLINLSSSGGTFAQIAEDFIFSGGYVAGAVIERTDVRHIIINDINHLYRLQGSKYLQSNTNGIYKQVLSLLKNGKKVLFSGTPCQVVGVYNVVPQKYWTNLYSVDLICHGVPSRKDLDRYLKSHEKRIVSIESFRDKSWKYGYAMTLIDEDGNKVQDEKNYFYDSFNANKSLRWSCYKCPFKTGLQRVSDITIGDFWGAKGFDEQKKKGLSLSIIHTDKGQKMIKSDRIEIKEISWEDCLPGNKDYFEPQNFFRFHPLRMLYPKYINTKDYKTINDLYGKPNNVALKYKPFLFLNSIIQYIDYHYKKRAVKKMLCKIKQ